MFFKKKLRVERASIVDASSEEVFKTLNNMLPCYWWDSTPNFGDWIGPWLISMKTGKSIVNSRNFSNVPKTIFSVGSVIHHLIDTDTEIQVWGSGLIKPIDNRKVRKFKKVIPRVTFLAVRGRLTKNELVQQLGINIPDIFGDPALLLPRYYSPKQQKKIKIALCPHYEHFDLLHQMFKEDEDIKVINVKREPWVVIDEIASADVCISSSLHGLIIAQAYGIPWIWLHFDDKKLVGDRFKFYDFYSTLKSCPHEHVVNLTTELNKEDILAASKRARLFEYDINLDLLDQSLV